MTKLKSKPPRKAIRSRRDLKKFQLLMAQTVMRPLTAADRMRPKTEQGRSNRKIVAGFVKPNDRLTSFERLEIYNRQYWFRIRECLYEDFPGLRSVLGDNRFVRLAQAYLEQNPSRSFTLRNLGSRLPSWIKSHPEHLGLHPRLALDMARLEWAHIEAFDLEAKKPFPLEELAGKSPGRIRLNLQPHLQLLDLRYPVDNLLLDTKSGSTGEKVASNAVAQPRRNKKTKNSGPHIEPKRIYLAVHRMENAVYYKRLEKEAFQFLRTLQQGKNLVQATLAAFRGSRLSSPDQPHFIQQCVAQAAALNWFCEK